jgi:ribonuclease Z
MIGAGAERGRFTTMFSNWTGATARTSLIVVMVGAAIVAIPLLFGMIRSARMLGFVLAMRALPTAGRRKADFAVAPRRALVTMLGLRGLHGMQKPLRVVMPADIVKTLERALAAMTELQRWPLAIEAIGLQPDDEHPLRRDLIVRAVRTFHPVPSLAYLIVRKVQKLRPEHVGMPGEEIARRRRAGEELTMTAERAELAYVTDTLVQAIDHAPERAAAQGLFLESTFLEDRKTLEDARAGCDVHLDELNARAPAITTPQLVLMHVSQLYRPDEVASILDARVPPRLRSRIIPFVPKTSHWPG